MPVTVIIIEDEPAIARNLQFILQETDPGMVVAATLSSIAEAIVYLKEHAGQYDLIFSDIHLSDGLSFEIFKHVPVQRPVIFVTAYDEYALQAFKANGIGYILKPFDEPEIAHAYSQYRQLAAASVKTMQPDLSMLAGMLKSKKEAFRQSFLIHHRDKLVPVAVKEIAWFYTANDLVYFKTIDNKQYNPNLTLEQLQLQLDPTAFFRANRQYIVRRDAIKEVDFYFNGRLSLKLIPEPPEKVLISKARVPEFREWMDC